MPLVRVLYTTPQHVGVLGVFSTDVLAQEATVLDRAVAFALTG